MAEYTDTQGAGRDRTIHSPNEQTESESISNTIPETKRKFYHQLINRRNLILGAFGLAVIGLVPYASYQAYQYFTSEKREENTEENTEKNTEYIIHDKKDGTTRTIKSLEEETKDRINKKYDSEIHKINKDYDAKILNEESRYSLEKARLEREARLFDKKNELERKSEAIGSNEEISKEGSEYYQRMKEHIRLLEEWRRENGI